MALQRQFTHKLFGIFIIHLFIFWPVVFAQQNNPSQTSDPFLTTPIQQPGQDVNNQLGVLGRATTPLEKANILLGNLPNGGRLIPLNDLNTLCEEMVARGCSGGAESGKDTWVQCMDNLGYTEQIPPDIYSRDENGFTLEERTTREDIDIILGQSNPLLGMTGDGNIYLESPSAQGIITINNFHELFEEGGDFDIFRRVLLEGLISVQCTDGTGNNLGMHPFDYALAASSDPSFTDDRAHFTSGTNLYNRQAIYPSTTGTSTSNRYSTRQTYGGYTSGRYTGSSYNSLGTGSSSYRTPSYGTTNGFMQFIQTLTPILAIGGVAVGVIALIKAKDTEKDIKKLKKQIANNST